MNKLSCEQLMEIIVQLDNSYKKEIKNKNFEVNCLKELLLNNDIQDTKMKVTSYAKCFECYQLLCNYDHWEDDDEAENILTVENIFVCQVCSHKTCSNCNWGSCCIPCFQIRRKAIECNEIVDKIKSHSDSS